MRYVDPTGLYDIQDDCGRITSDSYSISGRNIGESMELPILLIVDDVANLHLNESYKDSNSCDEWVAKVVKESGGNPKDYVLGNTCETVKQHIDELEKKNVDYSKTKNGKAYVVFMGDGTRTFSIGHEHAGIAIIREDGSMTLFHSSSNNKNKGSELIEYDDIKEFESDFAYSSFYYQEIKRSE